MDNPLAGSSDSELESSDTTTRTAQSAASKVVDSGSAGAAIIRVAETRVLAV